ncbi:dipicolinate synthase subunit DpsA [Vallitalea okinawensis]|uniref:dipicolinate synthase subunit DpsA n=1 Tax=Vallitalea okinawensis TaxID=2078660 RepID=UPI00147927F0|nr:dipicolinate synthase subunit DpsA [Vallitalea okinawensis]
MLKKILVLGGDLRVVYLANHLSLNNQVFTYGLEHDELTDAVAKVSDLSGAFDMVIGPIPLSRDNIYLNCPTIKEKIKLEEIKKLCDTLLIGCKIPENLRNHLVSENVSVIDILDRDDFAIANALPTAEGAIQIAMENTPFILTGTPCLVLGFGRCGKILAEKLKGLGAKVTVEARKVKDIEFILAYGYNALPLHELTENISKYAIIFNTIPHAILNEERLAYVKKDCLIIDLASKPGGTDFDAATQRGIKAILALGLPGKCAPKTASEIIYRCILNILDDI